MRIDGVPSRFDLDVKLVNAPKDIHHHHVVRIDKDSVQTVAVTVVLSVSVLLLVRKVLG